MEVLDIIVKTNANDGREMKLDKDVYITTYKNKFKHINLSDKAPGLCPLCKEKHRNLQAHHLIPKRVSYELENRGGLLKELRIRICGKCSKEIHLENKMGNILRRLIPLINHYTDNKLDKNSSWIEIQAIVKFLEKEK